MLFLRTAAGGFVIAATIVRLCEETDGRWVAICDDDREAALAACFNAPRRLRDLQHLLPPQDNTNGANLRHANLSAADLSGANGLTQGQLDGACGDERTQLDPPLTIKPCPKQ